MPKSLRAAGLTDSNSGSIDSSGLTQVKRAPFTIRGPMSSRGVLCDSAGVANFSSGGNEEVKVQDLGRSARETPGLEELLLVLERWAAICARRMRGMVCLKTYLESIKLCATGEM